MYQDRVELVMFRGNLVDGRWTASPEEIAHLFWEDHDPHDRSLEPFRVSVDSWIRDPDGLDSSWDEHYLSQRRAFGMLLGAVARVQVELVEHGAAA